MFYNDMRENVVMEMMLYFHDDMCELSCGFFIMIITNALVACCEVVIVRLSTNGPRGLVYLMISWEPITTKENITSNTLWYGYNLI
jgi:hypothetical protein